MSKPALEKVDPKKLYVHALSFYRVEHILSNLDFDRDPQMAADIAPAAIVLSALNSELFLKCLVCIETGIAPRGHHLLNLFNQVSKPTRDRIEAIWDNEVAPHRQEHWQKIETALGRQINRDLTSALDGASTTFEKMRYGYEGNNDDIEFYINDLPRVLGRVITQLRPEFLGLRRQFSEVGQSPLESERQSGPEKPAN